MAAIGDAAGPPTAVFVMENRAPYAMPAAAPRGPRNLTVPLAAWLRTLGFTATEQPYATLSTVAAHWLGPRGERIEFSYIRQAGPVPDATCQLQVCWPGQPPAKLFGAQRVRRLKDVRLLLLGNVHYHNARLLAKPAPSPAP